MKNPFEVLRSKEQEMSRVRKEVDALRITARLIAEDDSGAHAHKETSETGLVLLADIDAEQPSA